MHGRSVIRAILLLAAIPATLAAQDSIPAARALILSIGAGTGSAALSCEACVSRRDASVAALLRLGLSVRPRLILSLEGSGWSKDFTSAQGSAAAKFLFANATAQWQPRATSGFFAKGGVGLARITDDITTGAGETAISATGPAFVLGAGWNLPVRGQWSLAPYAEIDFAMRSSQTVNGVGMEEKLGGNMLHIGVAAILGGRPKPVARQFPPPIIATVNQDSIDRARAEQARLDSITDARRREAQRLRDERDRMIANSTAKAREAEAIAVRETEAMRATLVTPLHFDFDKAELRDDARQTLDAKLPILIANADMTVRIAGHTDSRGTEAVNRTLSERRAAAARDYLVARGVAASRIEVVQFGKDRPLCTTTDDACQARNRRTEFEITGSPVVLKKP